MRKHVKIPVIRNKVVARPSKKKSGLGKMSVICAVLAIMVLFVWIKVKTNLLLAEVQQLTLDKQRQLTANEQLKAEVVELSSFSRIHRIAREHLNLDFLTHAEIVEIQTQ